MSLLYDENIRDTAVCPEEEQRRKYTRGCWVTGAFQQVNLHHHTSRLLLQLEKPSECVRIYRNSHTNGLVKCESAFVFCIGNLLCMECSCIWMYTPTCDVPYWCILRYLKVIWGNSIAWNSNKRSRWCLFSKISIYNWQDAMYGVRVRKICENRSEQ